MARISTYAVDNNINPSDKVLGSDSQGLGTKNYTFQGIVDWFNATGGVAINEQNNYFFQSTAGNIGRQQGTVSFNSFGGVGTLFSAITQVKLAEQAVSGYTLQDYLPIIVGKNIMFAQLDNLNNFGIYKVISITRDLVETAFFNVVVQFIQGHGALVLDKYYGISLTAIGSVQAIPTLDQVLTAGNQSQLYAGMGGLRLYDITASGSFDGIITTNNRIFSLVNQGNIADFTYDEFTLYGATSNVYTKFQGSASQQNIFTLQDASGTLAFLNDIPLGTLQDVLDRGNTATNNINLIGNIYANSFYAGQYAFLDDGVLLGTSFQFINGNNSYLYYPGGDFNTWELPNQSGTIALISNIPTLNPYALTRTNDTNVTLTLGGNPSTALLAATSLTLGWTGTLADNRIASSSIWNAKQNAITLTTAGTGAATLVSNVLNIPTPAFSPFGSLTTAGSSGSSTLISGVLNVPTYTLSGLGGQPLATNLTSLSNLVYVGSSFVKMTGTGTFTQDNSTYLTSVGTGVTNQLTYWSGTNTIGSLTTATYPSLTELSYVKGVTSSVQTQLNSKGSGTVTSVAALTLGTTGTDLSSTVTNGTTTPVITLNLPTASSANRGALSSADWSTFNSKQTNLVSGTNIKSINGISLLGSGNLPVMGAHAFIKPFSGLTYSASTNQASIAGANAQTANRLVVYPFIPANTFTCSSIYINVSTLAVGALCQILIYSDLNGLPDQKIYNSSDLDCSTTGKKTATTTQTFTAGVTHWIGIHSSSTASLTAIGGSGLITPYITNVSAGTSYVISPTYGSAPTTFGAPGNSTGAVPFIGITI